MYRINYSNLRRGYKFYGTFFLAGLLFMLIFCGIAYQGAIRKLYMDSEVKAYRVSIETKRSSDSTTYIPTYYYRVNNIDYTYKLSYSTNVGVSRMSTQDTIYYKSSNPGDCVSEYETQVDGIYYLVFAFLMIFVVVGFKGVKGVYKNIQRVKGLAKTGFLIKGLPYTLVRTGNSVNDQEVKAIQVDYKLPSGEVVKLVGDPRFDFKGFDEDGLVDLLMDINNVENYYIDFNID